MFISVKEYSLAKWLDLLARTSELTIRQQKRPSLFLREIARATRIAPGVSRLTRIEITKFDLLNVVATNMGLGVR
jgi:hypothetical protein